MNSRAPLALGTALLLLGGAVLVPLHASPPPPAVQTFTIDSGHSAVLFRITHLGVSAFHGRFNEIKGTLAWADDNLGGSSVSVEVPIESVDSNDKKRDQHLKSPDFFSAKQFPVMTFKSSAIKKEGAGYAITGTLMLRGVSKEITIQATKVGEGDRGPRFGYRAGFESVFTIKRSDFGMPYGVKNKALGDDVRVTISFECKRN
jgi:polyisoprenoid-binding protein YceI